MILSSDINDTKWEAVQNDLEAIQSECVDNLSDVQNLVDIQNVNWLALQNDTKWVAIQNDSAAIQNERMDNPVAITNWEAM